jgi:N5-(cytidine 5'-diphosphoramidyl)-L-glutamine hydrolase
MVLIKKIGITSRIMETIDYHEERDALSQDWTVFLQSLNLIPVFIPNTLFDIDNFLKTLDLDGIILSGGDNIGDHPKRDKTENHLIKFAISNKLPLLGVCRGMQVINNFFTGEILKSDNNKHVNTSHNVTLSNSPFSKIIPHEEITVNSYHQNLIKSKTLGDNLTSFAIDNSDSTIEGFFHQLLPIIGIMWHPERNPTKNSKIILENTFNNNSFWIE